MSDITKDSTRAERICVALEYVVWHGVDGQCDMTKLAEDAKAEIEQAQARIDALESQLVAWRELADTAVQAAIGLDKLVGVELIRLRTRLGCQRAKH